MLTANFKGKKITDIDVIRVIKEFDLLYPKTNMYFSWLEKDNYKFALIYEGKLYPPKPILSRATGIETTEFCGGNPTNSLLRKLGFIIVNKPKS